jgi:pyruvate-ferredoxin/flavodoxin oxidoreductase
VLPTEEAIAALKDAIEHTYGKRGAVIVERNVAAVDTTLANLHEVPVGAAADSGLHRRPSAAGMHRLRAAGHRPHARGRGRPAAGQRAAARRHVPHRHGQGREAHDRPEIPIWEPDLCIDCGKCAIVCPHAAIRMKVYEADDLGAGAAC